MEIEFKLEGFDEVLGLLRDLPAEYVSKQGGPVKTALKKGAQVLLKQEKANLKVVTANATVDGKKRSTGFLLKHLIASRGKAPTDGNGERYIVRVKAASYPDRNGKKVTTLQTAQLLEYGSSNQTPESFIRAAFTSKKQEAVTTIQKVLIDELVKIVKILGKQRVEARAG
jgi:HK97 gp10 family phage protein